MTSVQERMVKAYVNALLSAIITDPYNRDEITDLVFDDVVLDIEETADWDGEVVADDIRIALARVLLEAIRFNYGEE